MPGGSQGPGRSPHLRSPPPTVETVPMACLAGDRPLLETFPLACPASAPCFGPAGPRQLGHRLARSLSGRRRLPQLPRAVAAARAARAAAAALSTAALPTAARHRPGGRKSSGRGRRAHGRRGGRRRGGDGAPERRGRGGGVVGAAPQAEVEGYERQRTRWPAHRLQHCSSGDGGGGDGVEDGGPRDSTIDSSTRRGAGGGGSCCRAGGARGANGRQGLHSHHALTYSLIKRRHAQTER